MVKETLDENVRGLFGNDLNNTCIPSQTSTVAKDMADTNDDKAVGSLSCHPELVSGSRNKNIHIPKFNPKLQTQFFEKQKETKLAPNILRPRILEYKKEQTTIYKEKKSEETSNIVDTRKEFKIIGQLLRTYIIAQSGQDLVLIDQHDAHERVIYDRITKKFENHHGTKLMFPEIIDLNTKEIERIKFAQNFLQKQGIETEFFGKNQLAIKSSPPNIQNQSLKELIFEILEFIKENEKLDNETFRKKLNDRVHAQVACKSAIKAGDTLSFEQMEQIVNDLQKTSNPLTCPHGRPTTWIISKHLIEKQFKRKR